VNVTKYASQKYKIYRQQMYSFKLQMHYKKAELSQRCDVWCALHMGALKIFQSSWVRPRLRNFKWAFVPIDHMNVRTEFEVRSFTRSWGNSDWSFGAGCKPQFWEIGGPRGSGMVPFESALVSSSIVTYPLSLRVSEILPLLCSSTPLFPTPPLVSTKFEFSPCSPGST